VEDLMRGEDRVLVLRDGDNFQHLSDLAARLRARFQIK